MEGVNFNNVTLKVFYVCVALLSLKMLAMSLLTARLRLKKKVVITPEDKAIFKKSKVFYGDADIERMRRAHRNDIENIPVFISGGFLYSITNPNPVVACLLFLVYTIARSCHTYVYAIKVKPQPARFLSFAVGYAINFFMAFSVITYVKMV